MVTEDSKSRLRAQTADLRVSTIFKIRAMKRPDFFGIALQRDGSKTLSFRATIEGLVEVLHLANFDREKFGYGRHRYYSEHLAGLANAWSSALESELMTLLTEKAKTTVVGTEELSGTKITNVICDEVVPHPAWPFQASNIRPAAKPVVSDSVELPTELADLLLECAERSFGAAVRGNW